MADGDAERTRLANERTYLAWWRTGLTAFLSRAATLAVPVAGVAGVVLPGCECGSVPIAGSLIRRGVDNPRFAADFDELRDQVRAHAAHEEAIEFPLLRELVPGDRLLTMANQVQAAQAEPW